MGQRKDNLCRLLQLEEMLDTVVVQISNFAQSTCTEEGGTDMHREVSPTQKVEEDMGMEKTLERREPLH